MTHLSLQCTFLFPPSPTVWFPPFAPSLKWVSRLVVCRVPFLGNCAIHPQPPPTLPTPSPPHTHSFIFSLSFPSLPSYRSVLCIAPVAHANTICCPGSRRADPVSMATVSALQGHPCARQSSIEPSLLSPQNTEGREHSLCLSSATCVMFCHVQQAQRDSDHKNPWKGG